MKTPFLRVLSLLSIIVFLIVSCDDTPKIRKRIDPAFGAYIAAYSSGLVSKQSKIKVKLASPIQKEIDVTQPIDQSLFDFDPSISGEAYWIDNQTIEFVPESDLPSGQQYEVTFYLDKLFDVSDDIEEFQFAFKVIEQDFDVYVDGLSSYLPTQLEKQHLTGKVVFADVADAEKIKELLIADQSGRNLPVSWVPKSDRIFEFSVDSIQRNEDAGELKLEWNGNVYDVDKSFDDELEVPALGDFKVIKMQVVQYPEQMIEVRFSDPIQKQNLDGLIEVEDVKNISYIIEGNLLKIYPQKRIMGSKYVEIAEGVKNINGYKMPDDYDKKLVFEQVKPKVRMVGKGVIVPNSDGLIIPFEAVSLRAVDLYVTQIFENNVIQFFQSNDYDGDSRLNRVGRNVVKKRINLEKLTKENLFEWNRFHFDLADIMVVDPGSIYRVELRFKKDYSLYSCSEEPPILLDDFELQQEDSWESSYDYDEYWDDYYYDWDHRDDPCHEAFYSRYRSTESRNVMASNIGLISKIGADKKVHVIVNDIVTTKPLSGVKVELYDYQQQLITQGKTNSDGTVEIESSRKPFLAVASYENQKGYLKLDDGSALSLSKFEVTGSTLKNGLKGVMYGERGVWRPGDSLYLTFVLQDKELVLPERHPVNFQLINPQGQIVQRLVRTHNINGFYDFRTATLPDDPTGNYTAQVKIGNRLFERSLKIETVKPNRLKIYFDFGGKEISSSNDFTGDLEVKWLHGAIAGNLKANVNVKLSPARTSFKKFRSYHFDDASKSFEAEEFNVFESNLDAEGKAKVGISINEGKSAPGKIRASFNTKVFEPGGNFSVDRYSILYSPYESYVGIDVPKGGLWRGALETDKEHTVDIVAVDEKGKLVSRDDLEVKLYKIDWRWWWDSYSNETVDFLGRSSTRLLESDKIDAPDGKANYTFDVDDDGWGRYLIMVKDPISKHTTSKVFYMDTPYWARGNRKNNENATMLGFSSDKENYQVGENVKISFPSPEGGRALVCIENGIKVIEKYWVETDKGETKFEFPVTSEMTPNVFCNITLLQPHANTENDQPIRMFGVIPLLVEDPETILKPVLTTDEVFRPETKTTIKVKEESGKDMTYTLAIVDEGLLDLTRFKTPDLWNYFYQKEALGVKTWDLYDYIVGAYGGELDKLLAIGGDEEGKKKKDKKANRFKPMVKFLGPFELDGGDEAKHEIEIPNYIGSVRVMVVAGQNNAYGKAEKAVPVRTPLMVLGTLPRVLSPGETVKLPVNVFALEEKVKNVKVEITPNELFQLKGSNTQQIQFSKTGDKVVNFEMDVANKLGIGKVQIKATSGKMEATYEVELDVRIPNSPSVQIIDTLIHPDQIWETDYAYFGIEGTNSGYVEVSPMPSINLQDRLNYLIRYPHGCIEQTTSSVFPQLFLSNLMELEDKQENEIEFNIKEGIARLRNFQNSDGGMAYWPGAIHSNDWGTSYATHFLLEAEKKGYTLPIGMRKDLINYQRERALAWSPDNVNVYKSAQIRQAYRLFTLALANEPELGAMNRMRELTVLNNKAKWRLAAAYLLAGQPEVAKSLVENASTAVKPYRELSYTFGSNIRDEAMILETLSRMKAKDKATPLAIKLAQSANSNQWMSTQTTAFVLVAMSTFHGDDSSDGVMKFEIESTDVEGESVKTGKPLYKHSLSEKVGKGQLKIENEGEGPLYVRVVLEGTHTSNEGTASAENVQLKIAYKDMDGNSINVQKLKQSTDFIAEIEVYNPGSRGMLKEMSIYQLFPSGWEIINERMEEGPNLMGGDQPTYQDVRDDRVYTYFDVKPNERKRFKIQLNATYMGRYFLPGVSCEAMYDNSIHSFVPGKWIEVVEP